MAIDQRVDEMEKDVKILKGEIKQVLLDLRSIVMEQRSPLNRNNARARQPMEPAAAAVTAQPQAPKAEEAPAKQPAPQPAPVAPAPQPAAIQPQPNAQPGPGGPGAGWGPGPGPGMLQAPTQRQQGFQQAAGMEQQMAAQRSPERGEAGQGREPKESQSSDQRKGGERTMSYAEQSSRSQGSGDYRPRREEARPAGGPGDSQHRYAMRPGTDMEEEADERPGASDNGQRPVADTNLVCSLIYWASIARRDIGKARVRWLINLYVMSSRLSPGAVQLLSYVAEEPDLEVPEDDAAPVHTNGAYPSSAKDSPVNVSLRLVELFQQLHGILCGDSLPALIQPLMDVRPTNNQADYGRAPRDHVRSYK
ncbi:MAG: hypothetical protein HY681_08175 [Chloroflexi bacterium]|nr:hypothetical protein [Chloroflexota bacterium]